MVIEKTTDCNKNYHIGSLDTLQEIGYDGSMSRLISKPLFLALFSAILYTLAMPNEVLHYGSPALVLIALSPLYIAFRKTAGIGRALGTGVVFALLSTLFQLFWMLYFEDFSVWTLTGVSFGMVLYFLLFSPMLFVIGRDRPFLRPVLFAAAWTVYEYLKGLGFLAFPWNYLSHALGGVLPLAQVATLAGMWPLTFLAALVSAYVGESIFSGKVPRESAFAAAVALLFMASGLFLYRQERQRMEGYRELPLLMVQTNADFWRDGEALTSIKKGQDLTRKGLEEAPGTKLVVWSENSLQYPYYGPEGYYRKQPSGDPFVAFLADIGIPLLTGVPHILDQETWDAMNSATLIGPDGVPIHTYGKSQLIPFAERVPFWDVEPFRNFLQQQVGLQNPGWTPGSIDDLIPLKVEGSPVLAGTPICFEDCFPYITRNQALLGASLFINLTNDSWSKTIAGETQHFAAARYRAIETGRALARSTNAGVTSLILPTGEITAALPLYTDGSLAVEVPLTPPEYRTAYMILGDWFPLLLLVLLLSYRIADLYRDKKKRPDQRIHILRRAFR